MHGPFQLRKGLVGLAGEGGPNQSDPLPSTASLVVASFSNYYSSSPSLSPSILKMKTEVEVNRAAHMLAASAPRLGHPSWPGATLNCRSRTE